MSLLDRLGSFLRRAISSPHARSIAAVGVGTLVSQAIPILITPILSRIYSPEDFGVWGVFSSYASVLSVAVCGRYEVAIVRAKGALERDVLVGLSFRILLWFSLVFLLAVALDDALSFGILGDGMGRLGYLLPLYVLSLGLVQIVYSVANWGEHYGFIGRGEVWRSVVQASLRLVFGVLHAGSLGLLLGPIAGAGVFVWQGLRRLPVRLLAWRRYPLRVRRLVARRNHRFPLYDLPSSLLNAAATGVPTILFAYYYGEAITGHWTMGLSLLFLPVSFAGSAIGSVYYRNACLMSACDLRRFTARLFNVLSLSGAAFNGLILFLGGWGLPLLLGSRWDLAGDYTEVLTFWTYVVLVVSPVSTLLLVKDRQGVGLLFNVLLISGRLLVVLICGVLGLPAHVSVLLYSLVSGLFWLCQGAYFIVLLRLGWRPILPSLLVLLVFSLVWWGRVLSHAGQFTF